jgi:Domain of unknown function (DUF6443)
MNMSKFFYTLIVLGILFLHTYTTCGQAVTPSANVPSWTGAIINPTYIQVTSYPDIANYNNTDNRNFIRTFTPHKATDDPNELTIDNNTSLSEIQTTYYDGLGRPLQEIIQGSWSDAYRDLVQLHTYDQIGREAYQYLPFSSSDPNNHSKLKASPLSNLSSQYNALYPGEQPYSKTEFDNSPLNRVNTTMAPGHSWVGSSRGVENSYATNTNSLFTHIYIYIWF